MNKQNNLSTQAENVEHLVRPRINVLLEKAIEKPLVLVSAGAGYGKTQAVYDFVKESEIATLWVQLSEQDNVPSRFWESFVHGISHIKGFSVDDYKNLGFPDTDDKFDRYLSFRDRGMAALSYRRYLAVFDDFHLIQNQEVIGFVKRFIQTTQKKHSVILISRESPKINIAALRVRGDVCDIQEEDLKFTENELSQYLSKQGLSVSPSVLQDIYRDIDGWAFPINLIARSLQKSPGYSGFTRDAIKTNLFELMEDEVFNPVSEELKRFLVRLSLIENLSKDLIETLAGGDEALLTEFWQQNTYTRYDAYMNVYLIHHLFLDLLRAKQGILTEEEKRGTYQAAAEWCEKNEYIIDAIGYYEKTADYAAIVSILTDMPFFLPYDLALYVLEIFRRVPEEMFLQVDLLAVTYLRAVINLGLEQEFASLVEAFEKKLLILPKENVLRKHTLGLICYFKGLMRFFTSTVDDRYDFDVYFARMDEYLLDTPIEPGIWLANNLGSWANGFGSDRQEAAQEYIEASIRMGVHVNACLSGIMAGMDGLANGELQFYNGDTQAAEPLLASAAEKARDVKQYDTVHRALFYAMRCAFAQGKHDQARQALTDMEALLDENEYAQRFITYDIAKGWYYYILRQPDMIPSWLKEKFSAYGHAFFFENFGNQMKARAHYMAKNFAPLLAYIDEMKGRESILYGRIEMFAMEACAHYQMRDRTRAMAALRNAYEASSAFGILMPFIELGKDMRTLAAAAMQKPDCGIPRQWLATVNKRASLYAKYQSMMISAYEEKNGISSWMALSARETEVLRDLYAGLSRTDIAVKQGLSVNTVNTNVNSIYAKLHANNVADIIRVAIERKLL